MQLQIRSLAGLLMLTAALTLMPVHPSGDGLGYQDAAANNAGGNGNGKGQGGAKAGANGGGPGGANGGGSVAAGGLAKGQNYDVNGRINAIVKASSVAWQNPNSRIGKIAQALTAAFEGQLSAVSSAADGEVVALSPELVSILATISNKELTQEDLDAIEARIAQENPDNALFQSLVDPNLETTNLELQTNLQGFDENLIAAVNAGEETNQGLGPIY